MLTWFPGPTLFEPVSGAATVTVSSLGNVIIGGTSYYSFESYPEYLVATNLYWSGMLPMYSVNIAGGAAVIDGNIAVYGGTDGTVSQSAVTVYNWTGDTVSRLSRLALRRLAEDGPVRSQLNLHDLLVLFEVQLVNEVLLIPALDALTLDDLVAPELPVGCGPHRRGNLGGWNCRFGLQPLAGRIELGSALSAFEAEFGFVILIGLEFPFRLFDRRELGPKTLLHRVRHLLRG